MKRIVSAVLILTLIFLFFNPKPADAGNNSGWAIGGALLGGFLLGSVLGPYDRIIVGPVYPAYPSYTPYGYYPPPVYYPPLGSYYPPPVVYQPQPVWIPAHYEWRWQTVCEYMYQRQNCYQAQITVFILGHWEY